MYKCKIIHIYRNNNLHNTTNITYGEYICVSVYCKVRYSFIELQITYKFYSLSYTIEYSNIIYINIIQSICVVYTHTGTVF